MFFFFWVQSGTYLHCRTEANPRCLGHEPTGVYVDPASLKSELGDQYSGVDPEELPNDEEFFNDIMEREVGLTVRLVIVYGSLKIGSVRSAFEESVGSRIKKFGGAENRELLNRSLPHSLLFSYYMSQVCTRKFSCCCNITSLQHKALVLYANHLHHCNFSTKC